MSDFMLRHKEDRKSYLLSGIRNIFLIPAAMILVEMHSVYWISEPYIDSVLTTYIRHESWYPEYLWFALGYCAIVFVVFSLIDVLLKSRKHHQDD